MAQPHRGHQQPRGQGPQGAHADLRHDDGGRLGQVAGRGGGIQRAPREDEQGYVDVHQRGHRQELQHVEGARGGGARRQARARALLQPRARAGVERLLRERDGAARQPRQGAAGHLPPQEPRDGELLRGLAGGGGAREGAPREGQDVDRQEDAPQLGDGLHAVGGLRAVVQGDQRQAQDGRRPHRQPHHGRGPRDVAGERRAPEVAAARLQPLLAAHAAAGVEHLLGAPRDAAAGAGGGGAHGEDGARGHQGLRVGEEEGLRDVEAPVREHQESAQEPGAAHGGAARRDLQALADGDPDRQGAVPQGRLPREELPHGRQGAALHLLAARGQGQAILPPALPAPRAPDVALLGGGEAREHEQGTQVPHGDPAGHPVPLLPRVEGPRADRDAQAPRVPAPPEGGAGGGGPRGPDHQEAPPRAPRCHAAGLAPPHPQVPPARGLPGRHRPPAPAEVPGAVGGGGG
mmetsp:Transcript_42148/g.134755  ORF Transcript_42148/g.134755 Transcript_42148/m.134755 type:complete len:462 (-) Transcript_42148:2644-4029(-)